jgi:hypothetical protein
MTPEEKLLYLYLLTNRHTTFLGLYRLTIETIIRETRLEKTFIEKTLAMFTADKKAFYSHGFIFIPKWIIPKESLNDG